MLEEQWDTIGVIGAGGKMGSGIVLLLLQELLRQQEAQPKKTLQLIAVDTQEEALQGLRSYLHHQLSKSAQRQGHQDPHAFADAGLKSVITSTQLSDLSPATWIFEAAPENLDLKVSIYKTLKQICAKETLYFTNTSSLPIHILDEQASLQHRIIGYHFYNPPAVQKLLEIIAPEKTLPSLTTLATELAQRLGKIVIPSRDIAGFIGNGHFMRDVRYACHLLQHEKETSAPERLALINKVSQEYLLRPMGIFQLMDYVGLDVCEKIFYVMNTYIEGEDFEEPLFTLMLQTGKGGGQFSDGSQKDGFFQYQKGRPVAVFDLATESYQPLQEERIVERLGALPEGHQSWKSWLKCEDKERRLLAYFQALFAGESRGCRMAQEYMRESKRIGELLVTSGVAASAEDVNTVMEKGFFHTYGPLHDSVYSVL